MDTGAILRKVRALSDGGYTDEALLELVQEGWTVARRGLAGESERVYADDMLAFYVLSQLDLQNGDLAMYNNHIAMYNNALLEYRRAVEQQADADALVFRNVFA